ncbi:MAG: twin-arginine translocase TatA/TatE family subunit [Alphaproteobacteria bacterium]|nr:twin-arginine translocase TatA/TatE family subunit [Alphaproteobacteria bacterium]
MFGRLGWTEILVIVVLLVILFGHSKIPGMMKNLANGINVFKKEIKNKDDNQQKTVTKKASVKTTKSRKVVKNTKTKKK